MNSTITIDDTDEEVIDLDSSQDATNDTDNDQSECSVEKVSESDNSTNRIDAPANVDDKGNTPEPQSCDDSNVAKPLFKVIFRDVSASRQYSKRIKEFLEELVSSKIKSQENDDTLTLDIWDDIDSTSQSVEITESEDSQDVICDTLFTVDTQPKLKDDFDVPTYGKKYKDVFEKSKDVPNSEPKDDCAPKLMCFNCMDNHNLRDCTKPRNQANINKNRKNFNMKGNAKSLRYHLEDEYKFGNMIPGQISSNLRKALGLKDNELPRHIYRMRTLGYPPGWLEEARLQHSGLSLFNSDGVAEDDPNEEPGTVFDEGDRDQYDIKKICDFPGFNVPPPPGTYDDDKGHYWASGMQSVNSKETMLLMLRGKKADEGYKRKKLKISNTSLKNSPAPEPSEMDIEDVEESVVESVPVNGHFVPPLPQESTPKPPEPQESTPKPPEPQESTPKPPEPHESTPKPPEPHESTPKSPEPQSLAASQDSDYHSQEFQLPESPENSALPASRMNSPSLTDLENIKKQLLVELQESNSQSNSDVLSKNNSLNVTLNSDMPPPSNEVTPEANRIRRHTANTSQGSVKSIDLGTPVLESNSPYSKLPSSDHFSRNICDVINFENLPDSTGKYEQMSEVLQKVRCTLAKLHQE